MGSVDSILAEVVALHDMLEEAAVEAERERMEELEHQVRRISLLPLMSACLPRDQYEAWMTWRLAAFRVASRRAIARRERAEEALRLLEEKS